MRTFNFILFQRFIYFTIIYFFSVITIMSISNRTLQINFPNISAKKILLIIVINLFLGMLTLIVHAIMIFHYRYKLPIFIISLNLISLLTYFFIIIYSLSKNLLSVSNTIQKMSTLEYYNTSLRTLYDGVRGFKHDFDNIVTTIGGYIKTNDTYGLQNYYDHLNFDCQKLNTISLLSPKIINNPGIYNLLSKKYQYAIENNIKVNLSFMLDLSSLNMNVYEFTRILGILLDNAIEASATSNEKIINLTFRNDIRISRQLVIIENTYSNKDVNTENIFEKGISSKDNHTGLGLWTVKKILSKNHNVNLSTSKDNKFFSQQLEIY